MQPPGAGNVPPIREVQEGPPPLLAAGGIPLEFFTLEGSAWPNRVFG